MHRKVSNKGRKVTHLTFICPFWPWKSNHHQWCIIKVGNFKFQPNCTSGAKVIGNIRNLESLLRLKAQCIPYDEWKISECRKMKQNFKWVNSMYLWKNRALQFLQNKLSISPSITKTALPSQRCRRRRPGPSLRPSRAGSVPCRQWWPCGRRCRIAKCSAPTGNGPGVVTIKFQSKLSSFKENWNWVSSVPLLFTSLTGN